MTQSPPDLQTPGAASRGTPSQRWFGRPMERLAAVERHVLERARARSPISADVNSEFEGKLGFGDRLADQIARVGGSWSFILGFFAFLIGWTVINTVLLSADAFDPYPFIFLNLVLSMIAAVQAPIIMMSQNRSAARDRLDASHDYAVNLKAEIEILSLHEKLDELRSHETRQSLALLGEIASRLERLEERLERLEGSPSLR